MEDRRAARRPLSVYMPIWVLIGFVATSCQSPQPRLPTARYDDPYRPIPIATRGRAQVHQLIRFFTATNPHIDRLHLDTIAHLYVDEAGAEGVNSDIAFCQMVHETDYLRFGGDVEAWQNNFCGLGATGRGEPGHSFPSVKMGIRAHIQHLKAYANAQPLRKELVDPRFGRIRRGRAPYVEDLTGRWASDPHYGAKLRRKLRALERYL